MNFDDFLCNDVLQEGKLFAYSKDGVRKQVKDDIEAANWRDTVAKPPKTPAARTPKEPEFDLNWVARLIEMEVSDHTPDTDGWDSIFAKMKKKYPQLREGWDATQIMDKACRKHLSSKDFSTYVEKRAKETHKMLKDYR